MSVRQTIIRYYQLTKPGIIRGNAITGAAGFLLASRGHVRPGMLIGFIVGMCLIIAAGCVLNNILDRTIDQRMSRTRKRALVTQTIGTQSAFIYATALGILGFGILYLMTNVLTVAIGGAALIGYVVLYGIGKRRSIHGTMIGCVPGALPPVAGYVAVTGKLDLGAGILFLILFFWQLPHFYAIAIYRLGDYKAAGLPVMPAIVGIQKTQRLITLYTAAFLIAATLLVATGYAGYSYLAAIVLVGGGWLYLGLRNTRTIEPERWARGMFGSSLLVIMVFSIMVSVTAYLP